ncbi:MAG TPA: hypothetical protein PLX87_11220 [Bacteroidales bacterium]|nr:hypothetical protein [Bacteroidales bacterium]HOM40464.1 hypothetical protein [Bacteroidales bacterium]HQK71186.1 hypothetical protein [Bacteroidales bacterium]
MKKNDLYELETIEFWENHYLNQIEFTLTQDIEKMLDGLKSKDKIKDDWIEAFRSSAEKNKNSDFARGAERIYYWLFNQFGIPNSSPIGADMFFETYNAFVHIDIKTAKLDNESDYKGKIPIGANQTSYKTKDHTFKVNLPTYYSYKRKMCLTYFINIIYDLASDDNIEIKAILLISVPNGKLYKIYRDDIIGSGKSGYKGKGFRYLYSRRPRFELLKNNPSRVRIIYKTDDIINRIEELFEITV